MGLKALQPGAQELDAIIEPILRAARIPGAGIAVVAGEKVFAKGYGCCDLRTKRPLTPQTVYPIASTTKAINAVLLGMLVDDGKLAWDTPVQNYVPHFCLRDPYISTQVTLRDLVTMRTGLPRHDWLRTENPIGRGDLLGLLRHLELSAGFRERFQYSNLSVTTSGHIAEIVAGQSWEELVRQRILEPLAMGSTGFVLPATDNATLSYHENSQRELLVSKRFPSEFTAPSGGAIHSTLEDMARWISFNLRGGRVGERALIRPQTLAEIFTPQIAVGADLSAPSVNATYAIGWFVDTYNGCTRVSHGGYLYDVNSDVTLFPQQDIGIVSYANFGPPLPARLINERVFDLLMGFKPAEAIEQRLTQYEGKIAEMRQRSASAPRVENTSPTHCLDDYAGVYAHPGYGRIRIERSGQELVLRRDRFVLPLQHWHYDAWTAQDSDLFVIHVPHAFDPTSRLLFETNADGEIAAVSIRLEPAVAPIRFAKL